MNVESLAPFLLILAPFLIAFILEALVIYFFKIKSIGKAIGTSFLVNILALAVLYFLGVVMLSKIGYEFNGLQLPPQVILLLWWLSIISDGFLLKLLSPGEDTKKLFRVSIYMNVLSYLFLYLFIINSH